MDQQEKLKYQATSEVSEIVNDSLYPFVLPHSVADWNQASDVWISFGDGGDKWNWLINHAELLTPAMLENVKTELWVNKYYSNMQEIENQWTVIYRSKGYNGPDIPAFEQLCRDGIEDYLHIRNFKDDLQNYSEVPCTGAYRLFLLYERAGRYQDEFKLAEEVLGLQIFGQKFWKRLVKAAKELKIEIPAADKKLIELDKAADEAILRKQEEQNAVLEQEERKHPPKPSFRMTLPPDRIDEDQLTPASLEYTQKIINEFYSDYPVKPFICKDQEVNNSPAWADQARMYPSLLVPKENMTRFSDGLLPGDVRLLYWLKNVHRKRIPGYFVYLYGICFPREKELLTERGYIGTDGKVTEKGEKAISEHQAVWL